MANGKLRTFDEFGWTSGLTPAAQRAAVQSALNSGEPLRAPVGEVVEIDDTPLDMNYTTTLTGTADSIIRTAAPQTPILRIQCEKASVENINFDGANSARTAAAVIVGPQNGDHCRYVTLDRIWTTGAHGIGIHVKATGGMRIMGGMVNGSLAGIRWENIVHNDTGDNKIFGVDINAGNEAGAGIHWTSGGGLLVHQCKLNQGRNHVLMDNSGGNTGTFDFVGNSLEGNTPISFDVMGNSWFNRLNIVGNNFGVLGCAIAVRNFVTGGGNPWPWLGGLNISANTFQAGQNGSPVMDIGCAKDPLISVNHIQGNGTAQAGVIIRPQCSGGKVNVSGSVIVGCATPWMNYGSGTIGV